MIDPPNSIDLAISGRRIAAVQQLTNIHPHKIMDVYGMYVVPGLVYLHAHVFGYQGSPRRDETALPAGTTTIVDAGGDAPMAKL